MQPPPLVPSLRCMARLLQPGFAGLETTFTVVEVLQPGFVGSGTTFAVAEVLQPGLVRLETTFAVAEVLQPGFVGLGTTFAVAKVLQPGFVGSGTTFAVAKVLQPGFVVFLGSEGHDISPVEMFYEHYTTNLSGNIVALFMDRSTRVCDRQSIPFFRYAFDYKHDCAELPK